MSVKIIPYSLEAEEALLGNIMLYSDALARTLEAGVVSDDFYLDKHKKLFSIMSAMNENREKVDLVSLSSKLKDLDLYEKIGGSDFIIRLSESTVSNANTKEYIRIIKNKSLSRQIIKAGEEISNNGYDAATSIDEVLENAEKKILDITRSRTDADFTSGEVVFDAAIAKVESIQKAGSTITGIKTYYSDFDNMTAGLQRGDLIILAARPSMGKTSLALNIALNAAQSAQGAIAIFSLEMPAEQLATRMLACKSKVPMQDLRTGRVSDENWESLREASQELKTQKFYIDDTPGLKVSEMYAKARKLKNEHSLCLIVVDYIQLIQAAGKSESRQQEVSEISRRLKAMARELNVPLIALSQLSRSVETRQDKKPMLSDLRESGALEQDADLVLFIYRDAYYNAPEEGQREAREDVDLIIAKHRNGPTGSIKLAFEREINAFYGIANSYSAE